MLYETRWRLERAKSTTVSPPGPLIQASRTFHSRGTTQSKTRVPEGTSTTERPISRRRIASDARTPSPVMLRQIGYSSAISACIAAPAASRSSGDALAIMGQSITVTSGIGTTNLPPHSRM